MQNDALMHREGLKGGKDIVFCHVDNLYYKHVPGFSNTGRGP